MLSMAQHICCKFVYWKGLTTFKYTGNIDKKIFKEILLLPCLYLYSIYRHIQLDLCILS